MSIHTPTDIATHTGDLDALRELTRARTEYEERLGWPVRLDVRPRRLVLRTGLLLNAVEVPAPLGQALLAELRITLLVGPVVADPSGAYWLFLTEPAALPRDSGGLARLGVRLIPPGAYVVIPPDLDQPEPWQWIERPRPRHALPPWSAVVGTLRRITAQLPGAELQSAS